MNKELILQMQSQFDALTQTHPDAFDLEFWFARDLQEPLGYARWENFLTAIKRAIESCKTTGYEVGHHFRGVTKLITHGKGGQREIEDFMLTRYGCYLIAQNGDPRKEPIAFAQSYFAVQTRKLELIEERLSLLHRLEVREKLRASEKALSDNIFERGVDDDGFGRIRSKGDAALFGGHATQAMKDKFGITQSRPLADFLPTLTIAAKNLATEMTNHNVQHADLRGEPAITDEHVQNNTSVRQMLVTRYQLLATAPSAHSSFQLHPVLLSKIHPKIINTMSSNLIPSDFAIWLAEVKTRIQSVRSALAVTHAH